MGEVIYESDTDRANQDACQRFLESKGFTVRQSRTAATWDMALSHRGCPHSLVEFKQRSVFYDPYFVDVSKVNGLIILSTRYQVRPIFIVGNRGHFYWWECHPDHPQKKFTRQKKRGIVGETRERPDPVYCIPRKEFKKI